MTVTAATLPLDALRAAYGERLQEGQPLARYTSARIGGPADALIEVKSAKELADTTRKLWELEVPFLVLGGGSNMLISDEGVRELVVLNHARKVRFETGDNPSVCGESGASLGAIARQAAQASLGGLEWAAGIPGTLGGAVVGNAGAHGDDISLSLELADILHHDMGEQAWTARDLGFAYRESRLKRNPNEAVVLAARLRLANKAEEQIRSQMDTFLAYRRLTQPPGASMGSMFKNPDGDFAGRLIEEVGLKGERVGDAQISPLHGNFFLNLGGARSQDVYELIDNARRKVAEELDIELELEIELVGDWSANKA